MNEERRNWWIMRTIEEYRAGCLVMLGDAAGRRYTPEMLDAGFRDALQMYWLYCPGKRTLRQQVAEVKGNRFLLPAFPGGSGSIVSILDKAGNRLSCSENRTERGLYLTLFGGKRPSVGDILLLELTVPHTIRGLDGANVTTVPDLHGSVLTRGAAAAAMNIRARSVTEVFGKRPEDRAALTEQAEAMRRDFIARLNDLARDESFRGCPWGK